MHTSSVIRSSLLIAISLACVSCASITRGSKDKVLVETTPSGADVRSDSGASGLTPITLQLPRKNDAVLTITKPGYKTETVRLISKMSGAGGTVMAGNVLLGGLIGIGVDAATGATKDLYPNPVRVTLQPQR
jgi:hypothetical protein